jgi:hypothetical protein
MEMQRQSHLGAGAFKNGWSTPKTPCPNLRSPQPNQHYISHKFGIRVKFSIYLLDRGILYMLLAIINRSI